MRNLEKCYFPYQKLFSTLNIYIYIYIIIIIIIIIINETFPILILPLPKVIMYLNKIIYDK